MEKMIEQLEYTGLEYVNLLDKMILSLESNLLNYFFDNIDEKDKSGELEVPLVYIGKSSDYVNIRYEVGIIESKIDFYNRKITRDMYDKNETRQEVERERDLCVNQLKMMHDNPKFYLRYNEFLSGDYSKIKNKEVRKI